MLADIRLSIQQAFTFCGNTSNNSHKEGRVQDALAPISSSLYLTTLERVEHDDDTGLWYHHEEVNIIRHKLFSLRLSGYTFKLQPGETRISLPSLHDISQNV